MPLINADYRCISAEPGKFPSSINDGKDSIHGRDTKTLCKTIIRANESISQARTCDTLTHHMLNNDQVRWLFQKLMSDVNSYDSINRDSRRGSLKKENISGTAVAYLVAFAFGASQSASQSMDDDGNKKNKNASEKEPYSSKDRLEHTNQHALISATKSIEENMTSNLHEDEDENRKPEAQVKKSPLSPNQAFISAIKAFEENVLSNLYDKDENKKPEAQVKKSSLSPKQALISPPEHKVGVHTNLEQTKSANCSKTEKKSTSEEVTQNKIDHDNNTDMMINQIYSSLSIIINDHDGEDYDRIRHNVQSKSFSNEDDITNITSQDSTLIIEAAIAALNQAKGTNEDDETQYSQSTWNILDIDHNDNINNDTHCYVNKKQGLEEEEEEERQERQQQQRQKKIGARSEDLMAEPWRQPIIDMKLIENVDENTNPDVNECYERENASEKQKSIRHKFDERQFVECSMSDHRKHYTSETLDKILHDSSSFNRPSSHYPIRRWKSEDSCDINIFENSTSDYKNHYNNYHSFSESSTCGFDETTETDGISFTDCDGRAYCNDDATKKPEEQGSMNMPTIDLVLIGQDIIKNVCEVMESSGLSFGELFTDFAEKSVDKFHTSSVSSPNTAAAAAVNTDAQQ